MTITITDNPYFNRYQWRAHTQDKPIVDEPMMLEPRQPAVPHSYIYDDSDYQPAQDGGSAALAAALWEMESAKLARANQQVGVVESKNEQAPVYGSGLLPSEVVRNQVLQRMGLTEGDVGDMTPTERRSLEAKIDDAVEQMRSIDRQLAAS